MVSRYGLHYEKVFMWLRIEKPCYGLLPVTMTWNIWRKLKLRVAIMIYDFLVTAFCLNLVPEDMGKQVSKSLMSTFRSNLKNLSRDIYFNALKEKGEKNMSICVDSRSVPFGVEWYPSAGLGEARWIQKTRLVSPETKSGQN